MACINGFKRHHPDPIKAKEQNILVCTRCEKTKYELENGAVRWINDEDLTK